LGYHGQWAIADHGYIDLETRLATLTGTTMVAHGLRVLPNARLIANLATGLTEVEAQQLPAPR